MGRRKKGARVLGPYPRDGSWYLVAIGPDGARRDVGFKTEEAAAIWALDFCQTVVASNTTLGEALTAYRAYLLDIKGNKHRSADTTLHRLRSLMPQDGVVVSSFSSRWAKRRYKEFCESKVGKGDKRRPISVDTRRNVLAEAKTFFRWLVDRQGWAHADPFAGIKGEGKRAYGKAQLRGDEWRKLVGHLLPLADQGDQGALAVLVAAMLGLRAGEVVGLTVRDVDDGGHTVWVTHSKTKAGRRRVTAPEPLPGYLLAATEGKLPTAPLMVSTWGSEPKPYWRDWPNEVLRRTLVELRLPVVTLHGLRGTLATLAYEAGAAGVIVAATLGHESQRTTERSYAAPGAPAAATRARGLSVVRGGRK